VDQTIITTTPQQPKEPLPEKRNSNHQKKVRRNLSAADSGSEPEGRMVLPGSAWVQIESSAEEVDGRLEVFDVSETVGHTLIS
jgi:hypothetical protein